MQNKFQNLVLFGFILLVSACGKKAQEVTPEVQIPEFTQAFTLSADIGNPAIKGNVAYDPQTEVYTLSGAGENMWFKSDEFFFVYEPVEGDFSLSSKIAFAPALENSNMHRKIGLMIRESLEPDARYADITVHYGDGLTSLQYRPAVGVDTEEKKVDIISADYLVLERKGNQITVKACTVKENEVNVVTTDVSIDFPAGAYVGLFICSHDSSILESGYFSEVKLEK
ncbi:MAG: hypothetical protein LBO74_09875 [Candidatus Symbiothrix sp.]|jgi:regulation of enolase protein 1 (concanavalin A-like superfamily)|nr:hypothetical protein [Candidatus Symbiothrix sp.]